MAIEFRIVCDRCARWCAKRPRKRCRDLTEAVTQAIRAGVENIDGATLCRVCAKRQRRMLGVRVKVVA